MTKQINSPGLKDSLIGVKNYIDSQANSLVIRTESTLWSGSVACNANHTLTIPNNYSDYDEIIFYGKNQSSSASIEKLGSIKTSDIETGKYVVFISEYSTTTSDGVVQVVFNAQTQVNIAAFSNSKVLLYRIAGIKYSQTGGENIVELTQAEYDALSEQEKKNGTVYFITDAQGGGSTSITPATTTDLGGIIVGNGLSVEADGTLSVSTSIDNLANYYNKTEIDTMIGDIETALQQINGGA